MHRIRNFLKSPRVAMLGLALAAAAIIGLMGRKDQKGKLESPLQCKFSKY